MNIVIGQVWEWRNITDEISKIYLFTGVYESYVCGVLLYTDGISSQDFVGKQFCFTFTHDLLWKCIS